MHNSQCLLYGMVLSWVHIYKLKRALMMESKSVCCFVKLHTDLLNTMFAILKTQKQNHLP